MRCAPKSTAGQFTDREREVLSYVFEGLANKRKAISITLASESRITTTLNLQFAHKDVLDLGATLDRYKRAFRNVIVKTYVDDTVNRENLLKAGDLLKNAGVDDTVVILVSGHGASLERSNLLLRNLQHRHQESRGDSLCVGSRETCHRLPMCSKRCRNVQRV